MARAIVCIGSKYEYIEIHGFLGDLARHGHKVIAVVPESLQEAFFAVGVTVLLAGSDEALALLSKDSDLLVVCHESEFGAQMVDRHQAPAKLLYQGRYNAVSVRWKPLVMSFTHIYGLDERHLQLWRSWVSDDEGPWIISGDGDDFVLYGHMLELLSPD